MRRQERQSKLGSDDLWMEFGCRRKLLDGTEIVVRERSGPTMRPDEGLKKLLIAFADARCELRNSDCAFR